MRTAFTESITNETHKEDLASSVDCWNKIFTDSANPSQADSIAKIFSSIYVGQLSTRLVTIRPSLVPATTQLRVARLTQLLLLYGQQEILTGSID